jgi:hypothetical protein
MRYRHSTHHDIAAMMLEFQVAAPEIFEREAAGEIPKRSAAKCHGGGPAWLISEVRQWKLEREHFETALRVEPAKRGLVARGRTHSLLIPWPDVRAAVTQNDDQSK